MGNTSTFIAVAKDFVLNWDKLSEHKGQAIFKVLRYWDSRIECLPKTFESLMKVFDDSKFYGYLVPPITTVLSDLLPIFPETGYAIFVAYYHPVVFVFNPSAPAYRILTGKQNYNGVHIDEYQELEADELETNETDDEIREAETQAEEEKKEEGVRDPAARRSKRLLAAASKERRKKQKQLATTSITARFRNEVVLPFLALPATEDPEVFLQSRGLEVQPPPSEHYLRAVMMSDYKIFGGPRIPYP